MNYTDHRDNKNLHKAIYNREITMSQYVTIPKSRLRRLVITEIIAWGVSAFLLLITLLR